MNAVLTEAVRDPAVVARLSALGFETAAGTPEEFARYIEADVARGAALLRAANFEPL